MCGIKVQPACKALLVRTVLQVPGLPKLTAVQVVQWRRMQQRPVLPARRCFSSQAQHSAH